MADTHEFETTLAWQAGATGPTSGNHALTFEGRPTVEVSAAPQYEGDPTRLNPEELFLGSLASCQMLTFLAFARNSGVEVLAYSDRATATLALADRRMRITKVTLRPKIRLAAEADPGKASRLVDRAHAGCFIANSVACEIALEPEITTGE